MITTIYCIYDKPKPQLKEKSFLKNIRFDSKKEKNRGFSEVFLLKILILFLNLFSKNSNQIIQTGLVEVNLGTQTVSVAGKDLHLTGKEYGIMELLSLRKGSTLNKEQFLNHLYGGIDEPELKIIDVFICKLRKKLEIASGGKNYIETVWGRGYILKDPDEKK